jgi:hypothetical protein
MFVGAVRAPDENGRIAIQPAANDVDKISTEPAPAATKTNGERDDDDRRGSGADD